MGILTCCLATCQKEMSSEVAFELLRSVLKKPIFDFCLTSGEIVLSFKGKNIT